MFKMQAMKGQMKGALCTAVAVGLLGVMAFATPASAESVIPDSQNGGGTDVTLIANDDAIKDNEGNIIDPSLQLYVDVPTELPGYIQADGSITLPTDAEITNRSAFNIHVSEVEAIEASNYTLVNDTNFATASETNALQMDINELDIADYVGGDITPVGSFEMASVDSPTGDNKIKLELDGKIKNIVDVPTTPEKAYEIVWTVAAGNNN